MTPRPHITEVPMPVRAQQMAEARAKLYRAVPLPCEIVEEPLSVRDQMFQKLKEIRAGPHTIRTVH